LKKSLINQSDKHEVLERLRRVRPDSQRQWGKMTAHQMICHLHDSFKVCIGEKPVSSKANFVTRTLVKWLALDLPVTWMKGAKTMPEVDQQIGGTPPAEFERDVNELALMVERFSGTERDFDWHPHPFFGDMTDDHWMRWGYLHMDHHLRQFGV
jgi:hypothetical protein